MDVQLRRYRIKQGRLEQFIMEWTAGVVPLREKFGFTFLGAWSLPESSEFVWVMSDDVWKRRVEQVTGLPFAFELAVP